MTGNKHEYTRLAHFLLLTVALYFIGSYLYVLSQTLTYPYQTQRFEGGIMESVHRILLGKSVYAKPSYEYFAFIYTPLYYYVTAATTLFLGESMMTGRFVSLAALLATMTLMYKWGRREELPHLFACAGPVLLLASYGVTGSILHSARVDMLAVMLLFSGLYVFWHYKSDRAMIAAGVLFTLAYFTKQSMLPFALPLLAAAFLFNRRKALIALLALTISFLFLWVFFEYRSDGWFSFYTYKIPSSMTPHIRKWGTFYFELTFYLLVSFVMAAHYLYHLFKTDRRKALYYLALILGAVVAALAARIYPRAHHNVMIPLYVILFTVSPIALYWIYKTKYAPPWACSLFLSFHLLVLFYAPVSVVPNERVTLENETLINYVKTLEDKKILVTGGQFLRAATGISGGEYRNTGFDMFAPDLEGEDQQVQIDLENDLLNAIKNQEFDVLILTDPKYLPVKRRYYKFHTKLFPETYSNLARPNTFPYVAQYVFLPREKRESKTKKQESP